MRHVVFKYPVNIGSVTVLDLPVDAVPVHIAEQGSSIMTWWRLNPDEPYDKRILYIVGTGHRQINPKDRHIGTTIDHSGFVWHVFEDRSLDA